MIDDLEEVEEELVFIIDITQLCHSLGLLEPGLLVHAWSIPGAMKKHTWHYIRSFKAGKLYMKPPAQLTASGHQSWRME